MGAIALCLAEVEEVVGKDLASAYDLLLQQALPAQRNALRESQRAWLKYQATFCDFEHDLGSSARDGSWVGGLAKSRCLLRTTLQRLKEIQAAQ